MRDSRKNAIVILGFSTIFALLILFNSTTAVAEDSSTPSVEQIVHRSNKAAYYQGEDGKARVAMSIFDKQGNERNREFTILRKDMDSEESNKLKNQKYYVYFTKPSDVRKMVFMVWKHIAQDENDDRWLYLPGMDLVKRIAATDKRTNFVGSHFFYEDVSGRNPNLDEHELVNTTDNYYVLKNVPKNKDMVEFSHYKMWIHKDTYIPVKTVYFDKNRQKYREYQVMNVEDVQGYKTVTKSRMKNLNTGGYTILNYKEVEYDVGIPEDIFTERYLSRPPIKYLR